MPQDAAYHTDRKRTGRLNVRLEQEMLDRLDVLSKEMCIAPSTLGALAIADYVNSRLSQRRLQDKTAELVADRTAEALRGLISDPSALKLLASAVEPADEDQPRLEGV